MSRITNIEIIKDGIRWIGYKLTMKDTNTIICKINNGQNCCETYGCFVQKYDDSNDDWITIRDEQLHAMLFKANYFSSTYYKKKVNVCDIETSCYLEFDTSKGKFRFVCFNEHNGYYEHDVYIQYENNIVNESI